MRGCAALLVVMLHGYDVLWDVSPTYHTTWGEALFFPGACGVDLFFMISGFIMVYATTTADASFQYSKSFWIKRFARIWPVYFVLTLLNGIPSFDLHGMLTVAKSLSFQPLSNLDAPYYGRAALDVGWTLNYEMYFYFIFGLSMLFVRRWVVFFGIIVLTLLVLPFLYAGYVSFNPYNLYGFLNYLNIVTNPMIWEFVVGVVIGLIYQSSWTINNPRILQGLIALAFAVFVSQYFSGFDSGFGITHLGASLAFLVLFVMLYNKSWPIYVPRFLVWLGNISFSLYLIHPLFLHLLHHVYGSPYNSLFVAIMSFYPPLLIACSLICAALSYRYLECQLSEWVKIKLLRFLA